MGRVTAPQTVAAETVASLPEGFKMTELGPLPKEWGVVPLVEVLQEVDRRAAKSATNPERLPILSLTKNDGLILQTERFGKRIATEDVSNYKIVQRGELVYNPYVIWEGAVHVLRRYEVGLVSPVYPVWQAREESADLYYIDHLLRMPFAIAAYDQFAAGAVNRRRSIRKKDFLAIRIPLPPLPEQRVIARVLRTVQEAKEATERGTVALKELRRSLMRHLFTYGPVPVEAADRVPIKETDIGTIPDHWGVTRIGEIARVGNGSTPKRTNPLYWTEGTIPWLTSRKVHEVIIRRPDEYVTELATQECHLPMIPKGSIVVAITGQGKTLGNAALVTFDTRVSQHLAYIRVRNERVLPEFLLQYIRSRYDYLRQVSRGGGSTKGALTCAFLKSLAVPLPTIEEQRSIVEMLGTVEDKVHAEQGRKVVFEATSQALRHFLMTGKRRVKDFGLAS